MFSEIDKHVPLIFFAVIDWFHCFPSLVTIQPLDLFQSRMMTYNHWSDQVENQTFGLIRHQRKRQSSQPKATQFEEQNLAPCRRHPWRNRGACLSKPEGELTWKPSQFDRKHVLTESDWIECAWQGTRRDLLGGRTNLLIVPKQIYTRRQVAYVWTMQAKMWHMFWFVQGQRNWQEMARIIAFFVVCHPPSFQQHFAGFQLLRRGNVLQKGQETASWNVEW